MVNFSLILWARLQQFITKTVSGVQLQEHQVTSQAHLTAWCQGRGENDPPRCQNSIPAGRSWSRDTL